MMVSWVAAAINLHWEDLPARTRFILGCAVLVSLLLLGALALLLANRWRRRPDCDRLTANDQLAHFRSLYERGSLTREEFDRVRSLLGGRLRQEMNVQEPPEGLTDTPPEPPPPPEAGTRPV